MGVYIEGTNKPETDGTMYQISYFTRDGYFITESYPIYRVIDLDLVRCGECKHKPIKYDPEGDGFGFNLVSPNGYDNLCPCLNTDDGFYSYMPEDNFFCAFGERRADEHTDKRD